ncbi:MAG TPA: serine/threonine-protein kinase, partial [Polyangiaceae bacterium]
MTPPALVGTVLDGKFQIERALASGAAGDVYEAVHLGLGSRVAVKVLRPCSPETAGIRRKRFVREARVAARIQSEHVVRVFDIVAPEVGPTYIVMELLQGETLQERVRRLGAIPAPEAVDYVLQAAKPLAEMHDAGIVHRDVKPSNVFLARDADGNERIKLLDFGVAAFQQPVPRQRDSSLTFTDAIVGTPRYMAPEQVRAAKNVDARADVWALGVTLYELLAGVPPFDGQTVLAVLHQIEQKNPPKLAERRPDIPADLAALVHRCLAKDPAERPADARALSRALSAFQDDERGRRPVDPLDLSLSDENVEVLAGLPSLTWRARLTTMATRRAVTAVAVVGASLALLTFAATRSGRTAEERVDAARQGAHETPAGSGTGPATTARVPALSPAPIPVPGDATGRVLVTTEPQREPRDPSSTASVT